MENLKLKPQIVHSETRDIVYRIYKYFKAEEDSSIHTNFVSASNIVKCQQCTPKYFNISLNYSD